MRLFYHGTMLSRVLLVNFSLCCFAADPSIFKKMEDLAPYYGAMSRQIWEQPELGYKENKSAALIKDELKKHGFRIEENVGGMPTAFTATWGQGKPVIGIMGEYDALPGLSQKDQPAREAVIAGDPGHGCGHNLFGVASAFAAITVKQQLESTRHPGTIRFYGTPAEEGGGGKIYMVRAGVFKDADSVLVWHPGDSNGASLKTSMANITGRFRFRGTAAHASAHPEMGRSALDGLLLFNHAIEMMREHVPEATRIHYIITKGGEAPNIVPDLAEDYLYLRFPGMVSLDGIWKRILKAAEGAAMATETRFELELVNSVYNMLPNETLATLADKHLRNFGGITYSGEENRFADEIRKSLSPSEDMKPLGSQTAINPIETGHSGGSTDVSDVSWAVPTTEFVTATWVPGVPAHSWQSTACSGMSIGRKGMMLAAKVLAASALDLLEDPALVAAARRDFEKRLAGHSYQSRLPSTAKPPLNYRDK